jgi:hypothetical protein
MKKASMAMVCDAKRKSGNRGLLVRIEGREDKVETSLPVKSTLRRQ